ncbi:hypothetical protein GW17_00028942, partial [Ensete ventricosum]
GKAHTARYIPVQQLIGTRIGHYRTDAAEAFLHLLCSLEEEVLQCYAPHSSSLGEITGLPSRIHKPKSQSHTDYEQWRRYIYGPFDGTVGSILTCRSCSSMVTAFHILDDDYRVLYVS